MNGAHYHLLFNHVPLFAVLFGSAMFLLAMIRNSKDLMWSAVALFLIAAIFGWVSIETGEMAEDIVKQLPTYTKGLIHPHEEAAELANIFCSVVAVASLILLWAFQFKPSLTKPLKILVLLLAFASCILMARAANLGGYITHSEIRSGS